MVTMVDRTVELNFLREGLRGSLGGSVGGTLLINVLTKKSKYVN